MKFIPEDCSIYIPKILKQGMIFDHNGERYIVANVGSIPNDYSTSYYSLISLRDGNRWSQMVTLKELANYLTDNPEFTLIED